jgi:hypothetical protein
MEDLAAALTKLGESLDRGTGADGVRILGEARAAAPVYAACGSAYPLHLFREWLLANPRARKKLGRLLFGRRGTVTAWLAGGWREVEALEALAGVLKVRSADGALAGEVTLEQVHPTDRPRAARLLSRLEGESPLAFSDEGDFLAYRGLKGAPDESG